MTEEEAIQRLLRFGFTYFGYREEREVYGRKQECPVVNYNGEPSLLLVASWGTKFDLWSSKRVGRCYKDATVKNLPNLRIEIKVRDILDLEYKIHLHRKFNEVSIKTCTQKIEIIGQGNEEAAINVFNTVQGIMPIGVFLDYYKEKFPSVLGFVI